MTGGASAPPAGRAAGYDYDTLAADLNVLLEELDLREAVLAGCCSGTGEVTRYLGTYGQRRVRAAALLAPLPPFLPRSAANPDGADRGVLDEFPPSSSPTARRPSRRTWTGPTTSTCSAAAGSATRRGRTASTSPSRVSAAAALGCAAAWREDFRADLARITVPVLIVQGAQDRVMPPGATGNRLAVLLADARLVVIPDGPHAIIWTHAAEVNQALLGFLRALLPAARLVSDLTARCSQHDNREGNAVMTSYSSLPNTPTAIWEESAALSPCQLLVPRRS